MESRAFQKEELNGIIEKLICQVVPNDRKTVKPVAIMFSEYYFYLIGFMADDSKDFPTIFCRDRITNLVGIK